MVMHSTISHVNTGQLKEARVGPILGLLTMSNARKSLELAVFINL